MSDPTVAQEGPTHSPPQAKAGSDTESDPDPAVCCNEDDARLKHASPEQREAVSKLLESLNYIKPESDYVYEVPKEHQKGMRVPAEFYASPQLLKLVTSELEQASGGFTAAVQQLANVATLPGIVGKSIGMPDIHSGYGFAIGNIAAMDMDDKQSMVSPGGVGFDINCGVRLLRSDLTEKDVKPLKDKLADALFDSIPVGVGGGGSISLSAAELDRVLKDGMAWSESEGYSWPEDRVHCEETGVFKGADPSAVSDRAKKRGKVQVGSLGAGNHYTEVQVVDEVFDEEAATAMGLKKGTVCIMIHTGSRGLGHQVCTDYLSATDRAMAKSHIKLVDRQLACMPISSPDGQAYLAAMACAANFAFVNRSLITRDVRTAFEKCFHKPAKELGLHLVYDVAHNTAQQEEHTLDGKQMRLLVHRKGATRAWPPGHPSLPDRYKKIGQPVLIGGSMGTSSYVLTGTKGAAEHTFSSTCHGAGRAMSRAASKRALSSQQVLSLLHQRGVTVRVANKKLIPEEAPESYKDVSEVVETCHKAGISKLVVKLRPIAVIKG